MYAQVAPQHYFVAALVLASLRAEEVGGGLWSWRDYNMLGTKRQFEFPLSMNQPSVRLL